MDLHEWYRPSWEEYAMCLAYSAKIRSEDPYRKVGACALSHDNRVLGIAYNGLSQDTVVTKEFWKDRDKRRPYMIHAESNLLSLVKRGECKTIAITCAPCTSCAALIAAHNIHNVIYSETYEKDPAGLDILKFHGISFSKIDFIKIKDIIKNNYE